MDQSRYKEVKTQRGFTYSYYFSPPAENMPVLFFSHGFPSAAYLWCKQIDFFEPMGYGLIVPDLLGYGGTDKPTNLEFYVGSGLAQDIVDIFDKEGIDKVISVSHDWGSRVVSRIANYYPNRLAACAFFGVGYGPPDSSYADPIAQSEMIKQMVGYDVLAYMQFFIQPETPKLFEKNFDSFFSLLFPATSEVWKDHMCAPGAAQAWIEGNTITPLPSYMTSGDKEHCRKSLLEGGLTAPLCWYKVLVEACNYEDDSKVPQASYNLTQPVLFVAFTKDLIALPMFGDATHGQYAKGKVTRKEVDGDHWAVLSHAAELNKFLVEWINGLDV